MSVCILYRRSDGLILDGRADEPDGAGHVPQITDYATYGVTHLASDPDRLAQRIDTAATTVAVGVLRAATGGEMVTRGTSLPKVRATRVVVDRFTSTEWAALRQAVAGDAAFQQAFDFWLADPDTDLNSTRWITMRTALAPVLWADVTVRAQRVAAIEA